MKSAHRLKVSATINAGVLTLGAAYEDCFTLAQAIAAGEVAVGDIVGLSVKDGAGHFEDTYWTVNSATQATRQRIFRSSANGAAPAYTGTLTVYHDVFSEQHAGGLVDPDDVGFDIILCAGQSNMAGRGTLDALIDIADSRVWQFGGALGDAHYRTIFSGADPLHMAEGVATAKVGPSTAFARAYAASIPPNRRVLLVPCAEGGTAMVGGTTPPWAPGSPGGRLYENAISQTNQAITAATAMFPKSRFVGTIWHQGESDGDNNVSQASYTAALKSVIAGFRSRITAAVNSFFIIGGMVPEVIADFAGYVPIDLAHKQVATDTSKTAFVAGSSGYRADTWHYTAPGARLLGTKMALAVRAAMRYSAVDVTPPQLVSAVVSNGSPSTLVLTLTEALDPAFNPSASAFTVTGHTVSSPVVSGNTISLTVSPAFANGEAARTVAYAQPGVNAVRDLAGNLLASFGATAATNNVQPVDTTAPTFTSAQLANANPNVILVTMSEALAAVLPANSAWAASGGKSVTAVAINGAVVSLTCSAAYASTDTVTVSYTQPGSGNKLQDPAGNAAISFGPVPVQNNVAATTPTTWSSTDKAGSWTLSSDSLTATNSGSAWTSIRATKAISGKKCFKVSFTGAGGRTIIGIASGTYALTGGFAGQTAGTAYGLYSNGQIYKDGGAANAGNVAGYSSADAVLVAVDTASGALSFHVGDTEIDHIAPGTLAAANYYPIVSSEGAGYAFTIDPNPTIPAALASAGYTAQG